MLAENELRRLYHAEGLSLQQIADREEVSDTTILNWMRKHGISRQDRVEAIRESTQAQNVPMKTDSRGYEKWVGSGSTVGRSPVRVHRLAAVAWFGWDAVVDQDVHHCTEVPWDNREANLLAVSLEDHRRHHIDPEAMVEARGDSTC